MSRPYVICHMICSLDGRLLTARWPVSEQSLHDVYQPTAERLGGEGWIVGRRTMLEFMPEAEPDLAAPQPRPDQPRPDQPADPAGRDLAICFDREGRLDPPSGDVDGDHLVLVLSTRVAPAKVEELEARGVSVFFAGPAGEEIADALSRIGAAFGVSRLLLEGGGRINAAFLAADAIDETSTLIHPTLDGQRDVPAIYDDPGATKARALELIGAEPLPSGEVWIRHRLLRG